MGLVVCPSPKYGRLGPCQVWHPPAAQKSGSHICGHPWAYHQEKIGVESTHELIPSGKRLHNYGKSQFLMGKSTINDHFSIAMLNYQRVTRQPDLLGHGCVMVSLPMISLRWYHGCWRARSMWDWTCVSWSLALNPDLMYSDVKLSTQRPRATILTVLFTSTRMCINCLGHKVLPQS